MDKIMENKVRDYILFCTMLISSAFIIFAFMRLLYNLLTIHTQTLWEFVVEFTFQIIEFGFISMLAVTVYLIGHAVKRNYFDAKQ